MRLVLTWLVLVVQKSKHYPPVALCELFVILEFFCRRRRRHGTGGVVYSYMAIWYSVFGLDRPLNGEDSGKGAIGWLLATW